MKRVNEKDVKNNFFTPVDGKVSESIGERAAHVYQKREQGVFEHCSPCS